MKNYLTTLGIAVTLALPHAAQAQVVTPPPVPTNIEVPAPDQAFLLGHGFGTQNYECQPVDSLGRVGWVLFTPQATLFGELNEQLTSPPTSSARTQRRAASSAPRGRTPGTRASCGAR